MFCQLLPTTFIGATIDDFNFNVRVLKGLIWSHDFAVVNAKS